MKENKIRTSITISPRVLQAARDLVEGPESPYRSVAALVEAAVSDRLTSLGVDLNAVQLPEVVAAPVVQDEA